MNDGLDLGEIPVLPELTPKGVADEFEYDVGFNLSFVGVGQGGGRIAEAFYKTGYRRCCLINTTPQDMVEIKLPETHKLDIGGGGAGKDPSVGAATIATKGEEVYDLLKRCWGDKTDYAFVCVGAGGGTGAGCMVKTVEVAQALLGEQNRQGRVGVILALPKSSEGQKPARNTLWVIRELGKLQGISPIILVDNDRIRQLFDPTPAQEYPVSNATVARYLHLFNRLAAQDTEHTSFDRADFGKILDSGLVAFGAQQVNPWKEPSDISTAIRNQLTQTILAPVDLATGDVAGLLFVCGATVYDQIRSSTLDHGFEMLNRILAPNSTVYRGIYPGSGDKLLALTMVGSLDWPRTRLEALAKTAKLSPEETTEWLG